MPPPPVTLDLSDPVAVTRSLVDIPSESGDEAAVADAVEAALRTLPHLETSRYGDLVVARTTLDRTLDGRPDRVVIAGHLDTVPSAGNVPSWTTAQGDDELLWGRGACDMKGGVAVQLVAAARLSDPARDITWIFYDHEEVEAELNGLGRLGREHPELLAGSFAVLCEPTNANVEGGCNGTLRAEVTTHGRAAHSARAWMGANAIHAAAPILTRLAAYVPATVDVDGLAYREGMNAVGVAGGIAGNVIPDACAVTVNYRFAPDKDEAAAEAHVRELFSGFEVAITDVSVGARPGLDQPAAQEFIAASGGTVTAKYGWTDVARFSALGVPAVNFGPGNPSKAHADDEFCPASEIRRCTEVLVRWLGGVR
ncbi:MAG: succinyl-diaminopimelate desuccinylase [Propionibacteriaceae bacterium]